MLHPFAVQEGTALAQRIDDFSPGLIDVLAREQRRALEVPAVTVHRTVQGQIVFHAHREVFVAMPGSGVHGAGAGVGGDVISQHHGYDAVVQRMPEIQPLECCPGRGTHHSPILQPIAPGNVIKHVPRHQQTLLARAGIRFHQDVSQ